MLVEERERLKKELRKVGTKAYHQTEKWKKLHRAQNRRHYKKHKLKINKRARNNRLKLRLEVLTHYGGFPPKCICCGESRLEFLTLDHIHGDGAEHRRRTSGAVFEDLKKMGFPLGRHRVLCMNCNHALAHYGYCPHDRPWQNTFEWNIRELHIEKGLNNSFIIELHEAAKELLNI